MLLDHPLHGSIYNSVIIGFLAVLGINPKESYHEATTYTPSLSAFVKLSQLLVVQRAMLAVDEDVVLKLTLRALKDDPIASEPKWSFLKDTRNSTLHRHDQWLLNRVARIDWL